MSACLLDEEVMRFCGCKDCPKNQRCNGVDLMNCYATKKLTIKGVEVKK
jgi:hypothetical protein